MRVQYRCINARMEFEPEYREYCAIGLTQCTGCKLSKFRTVKVTAKQMIEDEKHETKAYDYTSGRLERTW